ncbi:hypothetical protein N7456_006434 [Penicillium angulare]|uniref:Protein kinase domain-containing protein n=1 Tax=Penicillium angulare TaxID=116970 RepID=A0A9W9KCV6_9EURO|nr:hypothetical protein N7456_006434 [Penicillium angulare]
MSAREQFPEVHWIWGGGISFVYDVHPCIAVKVPRSGAEERELFQREVNIRKTISRSPPCAYIVQCFHHADNGLFLDNHIYEYPSLLVTKVEKLEPILLRKEWMNDLTQAVAFLESINLAHGDLRPENILLDRNKLKLSDFDCTAEIGAPHEACIVPYGRFLNSNESDEVSCGERDAGLLGPRTEQFALGSLYFFINYGFEVYGDRHLTEDYREHGPRAIELLQDMIFPDLNGDPLIDEIIQKCWHNKYGSIAALASADARATGKESPTEIFTVAEVNTMQMGRDTSDQHRGSGEILVLEGFDSKQDLCRDLEKRGLLELLSSGEPQELGFPLELYRYKC